MSEPPPDEVTLLEDLLEGLPDTGSDRELRLIQAVRYLAEFTGKSERPLPPGMEAIALRLTRDALFDLYAGFRLGAFRGISSIPRPPGEPSAAQIRLGERLKALLWIEAARAEMFRWFLTGLRHQVGRLLGESLQNARLSGSLAACSFTGVDDSPWRWRKRSSPLTIRKIRTTSSDYTACTCSFRAAVKSVLTSFRRSVT